MAYRPVPLTPHTCVHCNTLYYAKDKRRIYCTSSCNTLAWMARKATQKTPKPLVRVQPSLSTQDIATLVITQVSTLFANYKLNDQPARKEILDKLAKLEKQLQQSIPATQYQLNFVDACLQAQPELKFFMDKVCQQAELKLANHQQEKDRKAAIIAKKFG